MKKQLKTACVLAAVAAAVMTAGIPASYADGVNLLWVFFIRTF